MGIYDKIFKPKKLVLSDGKVVEEKRTRTPLVLLLLLIATVISVRITGFSLNTILTRGNQFFVILGQMFPPKTGYLSSIWGPLLDTIKMSLLGSFIGTVAAIPFAVLASTNIIRSRVVVSLSRLLFSLVRSGRGAYLLKYRAYDSDPGGSTDCDLYLGTWNNGRNCGNCRLYICLCRQAALRAD